VARFQQETEDAVMDDLDPFAVETPKDKSTAIFDEKALFKSHKYDILFRARDLIEKPIQVPTEKPPRLRFGLDRVLFNPGVYHLRNHRTGVFNFDPSLEHIDPVHTFDIVAMSSFTVPSEDNNLTDAGRKAGCRYTASTSSSTDLLKHLHFCLSNARKLNDGMLSKSFNTPENRFFTMGQKKPSSVFLRYKKGKPHEEGMYSVDSDGHLDGARELTMTGILLEKLLTSPTTEMDTYKLVDGTSVAASQPEKAAGPGSYHYTAYGNILVRSQLDAYDPRLPGAGIFDLKTRACAAVRLDWEERSLASTSNYQVRDNLGLWESYEREQFDLMRTAMLKYSLQVRLGRMDGIFLAYHNTVKMFGFQYMPLEELDDMVHGQKDRSLGDQELAMSMAILEELFERATKQFPEQVRHCRETIQI
jgi:Mitochondrial protein Pet127